MCRSTIDKRRWKMYYFSLWWNKRTFIQIIVSKRFWQSERSMFVDDFYKIWTYFESSWGWWRNELFKKILRLPCICSRKSNVQDSWSERILDYSDIYCSCYFMWYFRYLWLFMMIEKKEKRDRRIVELEFGSSSYAKLTQNTST